jgi:hypothetical protein
MQTMMKTRVLVLAVSAVTVAGLAAPLALAAVTQNPPAAPAPKAKKFTWSGSVSVKCDNGQCKTIADAGAVLAVDLKGARLQAEAGLRATASREGKIVEATLSVNITGW